MRSENIPEDGEWEDIDVADLIGDIRHHHNIHAGQTGRQVWITFEEAGEKWRYEWNVAGRNQWLHVRRDGEWVEVWSHTRGY